MDEPHDGLSKWAKAHGLPSLRSGELRKELAVSGTWAMTGAIFLFNKHVLGIFSISCIGTWALGTQRCPTCSLRGTYSTESVWVTL